jgi:hypothetical protein
MSAEDEAIFVEKGEAELLPLGEKAKTSYYVKIEQPSKLTKENSQEQQEAIYWHLRKFLQGNPSDFRCLAALSTDSIPRILALVSHS